MGLELVGPPLPSRRPALDRDPPRAQLLPAPHRGGTRRTSRPSIARSWSSPTTPATSIPPSCSPSSLCASTTGPPSPPLPTACTANASRECGTPSATTAFPITRGGGHKALAYSQWLLHNGWSLVIFPEGKRSRTGELQPFHVGPSLLALNENVPVLPMYIKGAADILPPGTQHSRPAPVFVHVGPLLRFPGGHLDPGLQAADGRRGPLPGQPGVTPAQRPPSFAGGTPYFFTPPVNMYSTIP